MDITDKEVAYYATFITGHPEAAPEPQHLAAARAVIEGLAKDGRLTNVLRKEIHVGPFARDEVTLVGQFDKRSADLVLIVSARLARQGRFVDMDVIEAVLGVAADVEGEITKGTPPSGVVRYEPGAPEPGAGAVALLMHPQGHVEHVHHRDDQSTQDASYRELERWWAVGDDVGPATWEEVVEHHDGPIFLVRVPAGS